MYIRLRLWNTLVGEQKDFSDGSRDRLAEPAQSLQRDVDGGVSDGGALKLTPPAKCLTLKTGRRRPELRSSVAGRAFLSCARNDFRFCLGGYGGGGCRAPGWSAFTCACGWRIGGGHGRFGGARRSCQRRCCTGASVGTTVTSFTQRVTAACWC